MLAFSPKDQGLNIANPPTLKPQATTPAPVAASVASVASDTATATTLAANETSKPQVPPEESPQASHEESQQAPSSDEMPFEDAMPSEPIPMAEAANADAEYSHNEPMTSDAGLNRQFNGDWRNLVDNLKLGLARLIAALRTD